MRFDPKQASQAAALAYSVNKDFFGYALLILAVFTGYVATFCFFNFDRGIRTSFDWFNESRIASIGSAGRLCVGAIASFISLVALYHGLRLLG